MDLRLSMRQVAEGVIAHGPDAGREVRHDDGLKALWVAPGR